MLRELRDSKTRCCIFHLAQIPYNLDEIDQLDVQELSEHHPKDKRNRIIFKKDSVIIEEWKNNEVNAIKNFPSNEISAIFLMQYKWKRVEVIAWDPGFLATTGKQFKLNEGGAQPYYLILRLNNAKKGVKFKIHDSNKHTPLLVLKIRKNDGSMSEIKAEFLALGSEGPVVWNKSLGTLDPNDKVDLGQLKGGSDARKKITEYEENLNKMNTIIKLIRDFLKKNYAIDMGD